MKTIELDFDKKDELKELGAIISGGVLKLGKDAFNVRLLTRHSMSDTAYASLLLFIVNFVFSASLPHVVKNGAEGGFEKIINELYRMYFKNHDVNKLEKAIEKELKMNFELGKKKSTDAVFGIWKNENITINEIREKAWQRTK